MFHSNEDLLHYCDASNCPHHICIWVHDQQGGSGVLTSEGGKQFCAYALRLITGRSQS